VQHGANIIYTQVLCLGTELDVACSVVAFFYLCNFQTLMGTLGVGRYTAAALQQLSFSRRFDNNVQSLTMIPGYKLTLYDNDNFTGPSITLAQNVPCLNVYGFNDITTSLIIEPGATAAHQRPAGSVVKDSALYAYIKGLQLITAAHYCSSLLHLSTASQYCSSVLHLSTAAQYCSSVLQLSTAAQYCRLSTASQYCSSVLQLSTAAQYCSSVLQLRTAGSVL
jgi:hypothetical protein